MSEVVVFEPREHPSVTPDRDTTIVTTNHLGADMRGDAGIDAQYLADVSGHVVIGLNRIGTGDNATLSKSLARQITYEPGLVADQWTEVIEPALRRQAPSRVELVGRSAGANLMLHVAALELIPDTTGILAIEALRMQRVNTRLGQLKYAHYQLRREGKFKAKIEAQADADLNLPVDERPSSAGNTMRMVRRQVTDIRHHQHLWASDLPFWNALSIADNSDITTRLVFAEESMAADPGKLDYLLATLERARASSGIHSSLVTQIAPHTTHGSFDYQPLYATHYRRFAKQLADDSKRH